MEVGRNHLDILQKLVGFPTVSRNSNRELLEYVGDWLSSYGIRSEILWNEDQRKGNLWATIGPPDRPGVILSGHTDVVPVDGQAWSSDPFTLRGSGERVYGRGSADMKGFIAVALALVPELVRRRLQAPVHLAFSYDEEVGCLGVRSLVSKLADMVARISFLRELGATTIAEVARLLRPQEVSAGTVVMRRGQPGDCMFFIVSGRLEVQVEPRPVMLGDGDFVGEMALITGEPRTATVIAREHSELLALDLADFRELAGRYPELANAIQKEAAKRSGSIKPASSPSK